ncbi:MAG: His/Gly/Thr/Pro-type tRNA ligase C-terminal domain-containing protein [Candidatus Pacebacteria bacterium]|nr:His/Gly/Thr/Pro-type tRNA ligase C-terminal domain-containing protein [Candidatus Paceibacterota bacterium]
MLQSKLFTKTRKEGPKDEVSKNAELLIRAGFIHKEMAGVYSFLPLGLRVFRKIENIIREEMNNAGAQELLLTTLQDKESWQKSGRWDDEVVDIWFKTKLKNDTELGLGTTHEEPLVALMKNFISSYKDLPFGTYQIQTKFRNEVRAKSGIMRGREFVMKDLYSFCKNDEEQKEYYEKMKEVYIKVFQRLGLGDVTYPTFASGGTFSKYSHEFQTITDAGEDIIYLDEEKGIAVNKEVYTDEVLSDIGLVKDNLVEKKAVEVGNIFTLGTKFSEALGLTYKDEKGKEIPVVMGSYGIGIGRVMGTVAEVFSDENGLVWPESISPFDVHLITIGDDEEIINQAKELKESLEGDGLAVLWDDRDVSAGEKFADSDLIGISKRVVLSAKLMEAGQVEVKKRGEEKAKIISEREAFSKI